MNETVLLSWADQAMAMRPYHDGRFPPSPYYRFLFILAANLQPRLSVELGVCGGGGSFHLCWGWPAGKVVGVDIGVEYPDNIAYVEASYPNFRFWRGDSVETAERVYREFGRPQILFIDTTHEQGQTLREFTAWQPYLAHGAIICLDDLHRPGMLDAWNALPGRKLRLDMLHGGIGGGEGGFGVVW